MKNHLTLDNINTGESAFVYKIKSDSDIIFRLKDLGLIENTPVKCIGISPAGDPKAYLIRGTVIAIRKEDAQKIIVKRFKGDIDE